MSTKDKVEMKYWVLTTKGIKTIEGKNVDTPFNDELVHHGYYGNEQLYVIVDRNKLWKFDGDRWKLLLSSEIQLNCLVFAPSGLLVGTKGARLGWITDNSIEFISSFDNIEGRSSWTTPRGGEPDVRSLSVDRNGTIYANIHVGWIARSTDGGVNWELCKEGLEKDVHMVASDLNKESIVYAATARGFHISQDSGQIFTKRWEGFNQRYQRAIASFAGNDNLLVSVSNGPHSGMAKLYLTSDYGESWNRIRDLPEEISTNINTYQITTCNLGVGFIIVENTKIYQTKDHGNNWKLISDNLLKSYQILEIPEW